MAINFQYFHKLGQPAYVQIVTKLTPEQKQKLSQAFTEIGGKELTNRWKFPTTINRTKIINIIEKIC